MNRTAHLAGALIAASLLAPCSALGAERAPAGLVEEANEAFARGEYAKAAKAYEEAGRALPESPEVDFDLANARFKQNDLKAARDKYLAVLDSAESSELLRRRAQYNLANTTFREAEQKLADGDLQGAVASLRDSVQLYQRAAGDERPLDDELAADARWNIEVTRLRMKRILDELKRRQEQQKEQAEKDRQFQEKLDKAIAEQKKIAEQAGQSGASDEERDKLQQKQKENLDRTKELNSQLAEQAKEAEKKAGGKTQAPKNVDEVKKKIEESQTHQAETTEHVQSNDMPSAQRSAEQALENLKEAREKLSKQQPQQPKAGQDKQASQNKEDQQQNQQVGQSKEQGDTRPQAEAHRLSKEEAQRLLEALKREQAQARQARVRELEDRGYRLFDKQQYEKVTRDW
jgi:hypothetical protein